MTLKPIFLGCTVAAMAMLTVPMAAEAHRGFGHGGFGHGGYGRHGGGGHFGGARWHGGYRGFGWGYPAIGFYGAPYYDGYSDDSYYEAPYSDGYVYDDDDGYTQYSYRRSYYRRY